MAQKLLQAHTRLFAEDVRELKVRQKATGVPWQTQLRALLHGVLTGPKPKAFKYVIREPREFVPGGFASNCLAIAIASSEPEARALLTRLGAEDGQDTRWLAVADVVELTLDTPKRLCWVIL